MKRMILPLLIAALLSSGIALGQEQQNNNMTPEIELEVFERCNNWARHYCQAGDHETIVNRGLLAWKRKGIQITTKRIRVLAQRVHQNLRLRDDGKIKRTR